MGERWSAIAPSVKVVRPVRVDPTGRAGPTKAQAQGTRWRRTSAGLYVPAGVETGVEQRIVEQGVRLRNGVITGWPALRLLGGGYFDGWARDGHTPLPIQVAANGDRLSGGPGVDVRRVRMAEDDIVIRYGVRCAAPERAVFDAVRWAHTLEERVVVIDMAAAAELTSPRRVTAYAASLRHVHDRMLVLEAASWADEGAESPQETRLRLIWRRCFDASAPHVNRTVLDEAGRRLGRPDMLSVRLGMGAEFDGAEHRRRARHRRDVRRLDDFQRAGLEIATFVGEDLDDERLVVRRLRAARERAGRLPRRWSLAPPRPCLDERLDQRDRMIALAEGQDPDL
jgi:hypothetical protein